MDDKQRIYKLASICLQYSDKEWIEDKSLRKEIYSIQDKLVHPLFQDFLNYLEKYDLDKLCSNYVDTFNFNEKTTLYLTYSKLGEERERGKALVDLKSQYEEAGYLEDSAELPVFFR